MPLRPPSPSWLCWEVAWFHFPHRPSSHYTAKPRPSPNSDPTIPWSQSFLPQNFSFTGLFPPFYRPRPSLGRVLPESPSSDSSLKDPQALTSSTLTPTSGTIFLRPILILIAPLQGFKRHFSSRLRPNPRLPLWPCPWFFRPRPHFLLPYSMLFSDLHSSGPAPDPKLHPPLEFLPRSQRPRPLPGPRSPDQRAAPSLGRAAEDGGVRW